MPGDRGVPDQSIQYSQLERGEGDRKGEMLPRCSGEGAGHSISYGKVLKGNRRTAILNGKILHADSINRSEIDDKKTKPLGDLHDFKLNSNNSDEVDKIVHFFNLYADNIIGTDSQDDVKDFFFNQLAPLDSQTFDRGTVSEETIRLLSEGYQESVPDSANQALEVGKLADKLGVKMLGQKGATGSIKLRDVKGKGVAIFKSMNEANDRVVRKIEKRAKSFFGITRPTQLLAGGQGTSKQVAEVVSYDLAENLGFKDIVPETVFGEVEGKIGSIQKFGKGFVEAKEQEKLINSDRFTPEAREKVMKMCVLDYLIGGLDTHAENWMVKVGFDENQEEIITDIIKIDNGNSFPERHPKVNDVVIRKNQFSWGTFPFAKNPPSDELKKMINNITVDEWHNALQGCRDNYEDKFKVNQNVRNGGMEEEYRNQQDYLKTFFNSDVEVSGKKRLKVLHKWANSKEGTLKELSALKSDAEMDEYINPPAPNMARQSRLSLRLSRIRRTFV